ncbi:MAG: bifunctional methylenetetrahydrofolate dehydrogenase/methenyltetrahydrofolate cyclohydrolase FolD [Clostridia bacterium]|nr:bifunctional methylenetetrahydrofolate dehydrogenase/methenyltetrahydrofolate cyclohydrolase FolD [Clostridia bacterium]
MCKIMDGAALARKIREELKEDTGILKKTAGLTPKLTVVLVGNDPASQIYVNNKVNACKEVGFESEVIRLSDAIAEEQLLKIIAGLNKAPDVHGLLVQLPLPEHIAEENIVAAIDPKKDVDGLHPVNIGQLLLGRPNFIACTPFGCLKLLEHYGVNPAGKHAVIVGRSNIVGKPLSALLLQKNATVTVCHSHTVNLSEITAQADILVASVGKAGFITQEMVKEGAVVLDVGINRLDSGKVAGDVDFASVSEKAGLITPVPNGLGPMTIAMLLTNTLKAVKG